MAKELITCMVCGRKYGSLCSHLKGHQMTAQEYRERFPGAVVVVWSVEERWKIGRGVRRYYVDRPGSRKGKKHTPEAIEKIRRVALLQGRGLGDSNPMKDPEVARRNGESRRGQKRSKEFCEERSRDRKRWCQAHPEEAKEMALHALEKVRLTGTEIERKVIRIVEDLGLEYRRQGRLKILPGFLRDHGFDLVLEPFGIPIEAEGCYWHMCPVCQIGLAPSHEDVIRGKVKQDREIDGILAKEGVRVLRFWEHDINSRPEWVRDQIEKAVLAA